jgi:hypothetical protein
MDIVIDFDGTCVTHEFPKIGKDIGAIPVLKKILNSGHNLILNTIRSNKKEPHLDHAIEWFRKNNIPLKGININPDQISWTDSPKVYGQIYIDDLALGCPIINDINISENSFVDWKMVEILLKNQNII